MRWESKQTSSGNALVAINSFMYYLNTYIRASKRRTQANIHTYVCMYKYIHYTNLFYKVSPRIKCLQEQQHQNKFKLKKSK